MNPDINIILIGMPATGKSTVGIILAKRMGFDFIDSDILIQTREDARLPDIISEKGLSEFLAIEESHVLSISGSGRVIATGGSVVYSQKAMTCLSTNGIVVYLETDWKRLKKRFKDMDDRGVVRGPGQTIESLYKERHPLYERYADIVIKCDGLTPEQVIRAVLNGIASQSES